MFRCALSLVLSSLLALTPLLAHAGEPAVDPALLEPPPGEDQPLNEPSAVEAYRQKEITVDLKGDHPAGHRGGVLLTGAALYEAIERPDLAEQYRNRRSTRRWLYIVGGASMGLAAALFIFKDRPDCGMDLECVNDREANDSKNALYVTFLAAGGLALLVIAYNRPVDPVNKAAVDDAARQVNRRLRRKLGVLDVSLAPDDSKLWVTPTLTAGGGGLVLGGTF